jgi:GT2 family glycosyltransferase
VQVLRSDGSLFWARGMHRAMQAAQASGDFDHILWLNDDTELHADALHRLLTEAAAVQKQTGRPPIMVGATADAAGRLTYGGDVMQSRWHPFRYKRIGGLAAPAPCDAMNGNCVLIPIEVLRSVGNIDPMFEHAMGDTDYALRARALGVPVYVASGFIGTCSVNPTEGSFQDRTLSLRQRWRSVMHRKGLPWRSWLRMTHRHGGMAWPAYFVWPYAKLVIDSLIRGR